MEYIFEFLFEGLKKFAGEIVGVVLLVVALRYIPGLRALFTRAKTLKEDDTAAEAQRQLELQRQEAERLKEELMRKDEALRHAEAQKADEVLRKDVYVCTVCGYVYDPEAGDPDNGVAPGTAWEDVPEYWVCPLCAVGKDMFVEY